MLFLATKCYNVNGVVWIVLKCVDDGEFNKLDELSQTGMLIEFINVDLTCMVYCLQQPNVVMSKGLIRYLGCLACLRCFDDEEFNKPSELDQVGITFVEFIEVDYTLYVVFNNQMLQYQWG